jgi:hypothetical protein
MATAATNAGSPIQIAVNAIMTGPPISAAPIPEACTIASEMNSARV